MLLHLTMNLIVSELLIFSEVLRLQIKESEKMYVMLCIYQMYRNYSCSDYCCNNFESLQILNIFKRTCFGQLVSEIFLVENEHPVFSS